MTETLPLRFAQGQGDEGMRRFTCAYAPSKARSSESTGKLGNLKTPCYAQDDERKVV